MQAHAHAHAHTANDKLRNTLPTTTGLQSGGERHIAPRKRSKDRYTHAHTHAYTHVMDAVAARARRSSL